MNKHQNNERRATLRSAMMAACLGASLLAGGTALADQGHGKDLGENNREVRAQLAQLEKAVSAFHSFDVAQAAGWFAMISECVESPMGGMGYHVANLHELGEKAGSISLLRPEVLLYAPMEDGSMEFLGVEYIVPAPAYTGQRILGQDLEYNPVLDIWALHVWIARDNPDGIFAPFNPTVNCEFAPAE